MAEGNSMYEVITIEVGEDTFLGIRMNSHLLCY